jgi:hypothetical protein
MPMKMNPPEESPRVPQANRKSAYLYFIVIVALSSLMGVVFSYHRKMQRIEGKLTGPDRNSVEPYSSEGDLNLSSGFPGMMEERPGIANLAEFMEGDRKRSVNSTGPSEPAGHAFGLRTGNIALDESMDHFHGVDWKGADGPWARAGFSLCYLYELTMHYEGSITGHVSDHPYLRQNAGWLISNDSIVVDIVCVPGVDFESLAPVLRQAGFADSYAFGGVITGLLPIRSIPKLAEMEGIMFIHPCQLIASSR